MQKALFKNVSALPGGRRGLPIYIVVSSPPATEEIRAMGREIESHRYIPAKVSFLRFQWSWMSHHRLASTSTFTQCLKYFIVN
jgi:hypothetical protein